jgi:hypothetical protein
MAVAFSPDGAHVLTGGGDPYGEAELTIWEASTGRVVRTFEGHTRELYSVAFSPDGGRIVSGGADKTIKLWDATTGQVLRTFSGYSHFVLSVAFSPDGRWVLSGSWDKPMKLWDAATGKLLLTFEGHSDYVTSATFSPDGSRVLSGSLDRTVKLWDAKTGRLIRTFGGYSVGAAGTGTSLGTGGSRHMWPGKVGGLKVAFSSDGSRVIAGSSDSTIKIWNARSGEPIAMLLNSPDEEWLALTPAGFFASSSRGRESLSIVRGLDVSSVQQYFDHLYRPDLVAEALKGDPESRYSEAARQLNIEKILQLGPAPQIELIEQRTERAQDTVRLSIRITDTGGGIGPKVVWRVNGRTQGDLTGPALEGKSSASAGRTAVLTQGLRIDPGQKNVVEITAYNGAGLLATPPFRITVDAFGATTTERPRMHVLAIGVDAYAMRDYRLRYAAKDAQEFSDALKVVGSNLFAEVRVTRLFAPHVALVNKSTIEAAFSRVAQETKPTDLFVLFLGGHGKSINGRYYFYPQDIDFAAGQRVEEHGISQDDWQKWIAKINSNKKLLILDTCESSAAAGLIRGGERERQTAMDQLQHATGDNLIAAARQAAYEGFRGHGVLTYAILETLTKSKDDGGDDRVDVDALARYVGDRVPDISQSLFGVAQTPIRRLSGQNFPLGLRVAGLLPSVAPSSTAEPGKGFVLLREERVREKPVEHASGERVLEAATAIDVIRFVGNWALIASDGLELGYVPADAVKKFTKPR